MKVYYMTLGNVFVNFYCTLPENDCESQAATILSLLQWHGCPVISSSLTCLVF